MGAYGMNTCEYCGKLYHDLDMHECDPGDMKTFIDALQARLAAMTSDEALARAYDAFITDASDTHEALRAALKAAGDGGK